MFGNSRKIERPVIVLPQPLSPTISDALARRNFEVDLAGHLPYAMEVLKRMPSPRTDISACGRPRPGRFRISALPGGPLPSARRPLLLFHELLLHQHLGADNAVARQLIDLGVGQSKNAAENFAIVLAERRRGDRIANGLSVSRNGIDGCGCLPMKARSIS